VVSAAGAATARSAGLDDVWAALAEVPDPELPAVSVVDLGMVETIERTPDRIRVEILPTFIGCPVIEFLQAAIRDRLAGMASTVRVDISYTVPWTTDRLRPAARKKLRLHGIAPPPQGASRALPMLTTPACPRCGSSRTRLEGSFGPTPCRAIAYCPDCREPFEAFKPL
jgi:ring-1,2-phenylacetyl-CoA epoxidase subunit PaaD